MGNNWYRFLLFYLVCFSAPVLKKVYPHSKCQFLKNSENLKFLIQKTCMCSWPWSNTSLNCMGPPIHDFLLICVQSVLHISGFCIQQQVESSIFDSSWGSTDAESCVSFFAISYKGLERQCVLIFVGKSLNQCLSQIPRNSWVLGESKIICRFPTTPLISLPCLRASCILKFKLLLSRSSNCNMVKFFKYVVSLSREVCRYVFYILLWKQKIIRIQ